MFSCCYMSSFPWTTKLIQVYTWYICILFSWVGICLFITIHILWYQILGDGDLSVKLNFKARAYSAAAKEKLEAVGCSLTTLPGRKKWVKPSVSKNLARAEEYFAKKRASPEWSDPPSAWSMPFIVMSFWKRYVKHQIFDISRTLFFPSQNINIYNYVLVFSRSSTWVIQLFLLVYGNGSRG